MPDEMRKDKNVEINEIKMSNINLNDIFKESFIERMNEEFDNIQTAVIGFNVDELKPSNLIVLFQLIGFKDKRMDLVVESKNETHLNKMYKLLNELK